jgi:hypothetical protein
MFWLFSYHSASCLFSAHFSGGQAMDGRMRPEGMSDEQYAEAQQLIQVSMKAIEDEVWRMSCLMACKKNGEMFGETEFTLRDMLLRAGAIILENAVNGRRKKGGTTAAALHARVSMRGAVAKETQSSLAGDHGP